LLPLYTPTRTDEPNVSEPTVFLNGISVCLCQEAAFFRRPRPLLDRLWDAPWMLHLASQTSIRVNPHSLGAMTVSMLRGAAGHQLKDIRKLTAFLFTEEPPDIATLPNSLLIGLARPIRDALRRPVACTLQGEELFLDQLLEPYRSQALELIRAKVEDVDGFIAVSEFSADYWQAKLGIPDRKLHVVPLGIDADSYGPPSRVPGGRFQVGFFARVAPEKGLHLLAEAYVHLRRESDFTSSALEVAGYLAPEHRAYLHRVERLMKNAGLAHEFHYRGELDRAGKTEFLRSLNVLSVPSTYDEPKGIFLLEAMASGVPVVQPRRGAFREILERTGGGMLVQPDDAASLMDGIYSLWKNPELAAELGRRGAEGVRKFYSASQMAARALEALQVIAHA
jgi:glycosyltransferase involved in cell wall biosynthesis